MGMQPDAFWRLTPWQWWLLYEDFFIDPIKKQEEDNRRLYDIMKMPAGSTWE